MDDYPFSDAQFVPPQSPFGTDYSDFHQFDSSAQPFYFPSSTQEDAFGRYGSLSSFADTLPISYDSSNAHTPISAFSQSSVSQNSPNSLDWTDAESCQWLPNDAAIHPTQRHIRAKSSDRQASEFNAAIAGSHRDECLSTPRRSIPGRQALSRDPRHALASSYRELRPTIGDIGDLPSPVLSPGEVCDVTSADLDRTESKREVSQNNSARFQLLQPHSVSQCPRACAWILPVANWWGCSHKNLSGSETITTVALGSIRRCTAIIFFLYQANYRVQ